MEKIVKIGSRTKRVASRIHYLEEWLDHRGLKKAAFARMMETDKPNVTKWCKGALPSEENVLKISRVLSIEPEELFRHPDDDWLSRFFRRRSDEELKRMIETLKAAFPRKDGTDG